MAKANRSKAATREGQMVYAKAIYQLALGKAGRKVAALFRAEEKTAEKFLSKQGIKITHAQVIEHYKRNLDAMMKARNG